MTMSSYAGKLVSLDDFYLTSAGLAVTETSIVNNNPDLWLLIDPKAAPLTWVRAMVATRLATSGREWVDIFARRNSGTYFDDIFVISGQTALVKKYGDYYSYDMSPRANIFRRDHVHVTDPASMTRLMRYNDYTNDPFSRCNCTPPYNPVYAISSRYDLLDPKGKYDVPRMYRRPVGGFDMKFTTYDKFKRLQFIAISGPTEYSLPAFEWSTSGFNDSHIGHPDRWEFGPVENVWGSCV
ncbi:hypothetical protein MTO96_042535 [Rhipicephalus appendiculatus]